MSTDHSLCQSGVPDHCISTPEAVNIFDTNVIYWAWTTEKSNKVNTNAIFYVGTTEAVSTLGTDTVRDPQLHLVLQGF